MNNQRHWTFRAEHHLYHTLMGDAQYCIFASIHRMLKPRMNLKLWTSDNTGMSVSFTVTTVIPLWWNIVIVGKLGNGSGQEVYSTSLLSAQFCCESKTALKIKYFLKGGNISKGHFSLILWSFGWCTIVSLWQLYLFKYSEPNFSPIQLLPAISLQFCTPHFVVRWYVARNCISLRKT